MRTATAALATIAFLSACAPKAHLSRTTRTPERGGEAAYRGGEDGREMADEEIRSFCRGSYTVTEERPGRIAFRCTRSGGDWSE